MKLSLITAGAMIAALALPLTARAEARRVDRAGGSAASSAGPKADGSYRAHYGWQDLFIPATLHPEGGTYDLVVHFHGMSTAQEKNVDTAGLNAVVVSVNLGVASDAYSKAFRDPQAFDALLAKAQRVVQKSGRAPRARLGRIALSAWSAGFAAVGAIVKNPAAAAKIDAVLLADGLHSAYADAKKHTVDERSLAKYARFADAAMRGEKLFVITHSSIRTPGYATATESVGTVLRLSSLDKDAPPWTAPRHMRPIYQANRGDFHVEGFHGTGVKDHLDHIWAMGETMYPLLAARWSPPATPDAQNS